MKILQNSICIDQERMTNCLVLIFIENGIVKDTVSVQLPEWFNYWSEEYHYYQPCSN